MLWVIRRAVRWAKENNAGKSIMYNSYCELSEAPLGLLFWNAKLERLESTDDLALKETLTARQRQEIEYGMLNCGAMFGYLSFTGNPT